MSKWLALALEAVEAEPQTDSPCHLPIVPTVPVAREQIRPIDAIDTIGTPARSAETEPEVIGHPAFVSACIKALRNGPLPDMPPRRWDAFRADAPRLCADWSESAAALGWQPPDFFGSHPSAPWQRIDRLGLAFLLDGQAVIAMDERQARLGNGSSSFYRPKQGDAP